MLEDKLAGGDVPAFLYTIPFFHNPTGAVMLPDRCKRLVALAQKYQFRIISDEPYNLLHLDGGALPSLASYDDSGLVVSLGSFSKILAPGLRLGEKNPISFIKNSRNILTYDVLYHRLGSEQRGHY